jgi:regulator of sirC expression with transglutaminase-like and TPR domain
MAEIAAPQRLAQLMQLPEAALSLPEAALVIASHRYPDLQIDEYLARIARASDQLRRRLAADASKTHILAMLNHLMFDELGYTGAAADYYDPRNSYVNEVMERRAGIPITLSILYMAIGQRVGLQLGGVAFPGHFLVRCVVDGGIVVLDPFQRGISVSEQDLRTRLAAQGLPPGEFGAHLHAASNRAILSRLLRNLLAIYVKQQRPELAVEIVDLILTVVPGSAQELLVRARLYRELECYPAALRDLEHYLHVEPAAANNEEVQRLLQMLRQARPTLH